MPRSISKILVPVDNCEASLEAAWFGLTIASSLHASLTLMHVQKNATLEFLRIHYAELELVSHDEFHDKILKYVEDPYSDALCSAVNDGIVDIECSTSNNEPAIEICSYAKAENVDLIVMGSRGRSTMEAFLTGSVSNDVLHHAPCPVTIVH